MINFDNINSYRENNRLEVKKATGGLPKSIWETYSAFSNTNGGLILLGVIENNDKTLKVIGLDNPDKLITDFWNCINDSHKVNINLLNDKRVYITEAENKHIIVIEVPRAVRTDKPVYIGTDPFSGSYRRDGEGDYHCTREQVRNMMLDQSNISQDSRVLDQLDLDAFDNETIRRYRNRLQIARPDHVWENIEQIDFLQKMGCVGRSENGTLHPTAAGVLMFGFDYEIVKEYPAYFLDYQEHDNNSTRWTDRVISSLGDWSGNLYDFYYRICNRITQDVKTPFLLDGMTRVDDTPVHKAIREALANALIHANYYGDRGLVIHKWPNKITIANPGGLRISVEDAISGGLSDPRNNTVFKMFNMLRIGDRAGSGIPDIFHVWKTQGWNTPVLDEQFKPDRTVLTLELSPPKNKKPAAKTGGKNRRQKTGGKKPAAKTIQQFETIISFIKSNGKITTHEVTELLEIGASRAKEILSQLVEVGEIIPHGEDKNRHYVLKTDGNE